MPSEKGERTRRSRGRPRTSYTVEACQPRASSEALATLLAVQPAGFAAEPRDSGKARQHHYEDAAQHHPETDTARRTHDEREPHGATDCDGPLPQQRPPEPPRLPPATRLLVHGLSSLTDHSTSWSLGSLRPRRRGGLRRASYLECDRHEAISGYGLVERVRERSPTRSIVRSMTLAEARCPRRWNSPAA
jgi:hypothetical protein